jgi:hypothetical protein
MLFNDCWSSRVDGEEPVRNHLQAINIIDYFLWAVQVSNL